MIKFYGRKNAATEPVRGSATIEAPPIEQVLRPKLMVSQSGKPVSVKKWTPKGAGEDPNNYISRGRGFRRGPALAHPLRPNGIELRVGDGAP